MAAPAHAVVIGASIAGLLARPRAQPVPAPG